MEDWVIGLREIDNGAWGGSVEQIGDEGAGRQAKEKKKIEEERREAGEREKENRKFFLMREEREV